MQHSKDFSDAGVCRAYVCVHACVLGRQNWDKLCTYEGLAAKRICYCFKYYTPYSERQNVYN